MLVQCIVYIHLFSPSFVVSFLSLSLSHLFSIDLASFLPFVPYMSIWVQGEGMEEERKLHTSDHATITRPRSNTVTPASEAAEAVRQQVAECAREIQPELMSQAN